MGIVRTDDAAFLVAAGQGCLFAGATACLAMRPSALAVKRGLSYYGTDLHTIVPYCLGILLCVALTARALPRLSGLALAVRLRTAFVGILALMTLLPLTPYTLDRAVDYLHIGITSTLFAATLVVGMWLAVAFLRGSAARALFGLQFAAGLGIATAQFGWQDYMIPSELVFDIAFAALCVLTIRRLPPARSLLGAQGSPPGSGTR